MNDDFDGLVRAFEGSLQTWRDIRALYPVLEPAGVEMRVTQAEVQARIDTWEVVIDMTRKWQAAVAAEPGERERIVQAIEALPGPNGEGVARMPEQMREGYLLAIEEATGVARGERDGR